MFSMIYGSKLPVSKCCCGSTIYIGLLPSWFCLATRQRMQGNALAISSGKDGFIVKQCAFCIILRQFLYSNAISLCPSLTIHPPKYWVWHNGIRVWCSREFYLRQLRASKRVKCACAAFAEPLNLCCLGQLANSWITIFHNVAAKPCLRIISYCNFFRNKELTLY